MVGGDFNARTGNLKDLVQADDHSTQFPLLPTEDPPPLVHPPTEKQH